MSPKEKMQRPAHALFLIKKLAARYPVYCAEGNHENRIDWEPETYGVMEDNYRNALKAGRCHLPEK